MIGNKNLKPKSFTPMVVDENSSNMQIVSVFDMLMKDRIIFLGSEIYDDVANTINAQLLYLDSVTEQDNPEPIWLYINSPGGEVYSGLSIYDTMNVIKSPVYTVVMGLAASMAFVLASSGAKGHRYSLPNSRLMMHQPMSGAYGQASDIEIENKEVQLLKKNLYEIIAHNTGQTVAKLKRDGDRDRWMSADESIDYGVIDKIFVGKKTLNLSKTKRTTKKK